MIVAGNKTHKHIGQHDEHNFACMFALQKRRMEWQVVVKIL